MNNSNHNKIDAYQAPPAETSDTLTNNGDNGTLNRDLFSKLSKDGQRMVKDDKAPLTKHAGDSERQINVLDTSTNKQERKKKKKKSRKKRNTIEALLEEDFTSNA